MNFAQESPAQAWIMDWVDFLRENLPLIFLLAVLIVGIALVFKSEGIGRVLGFGIGAALLFLFVTNVEAVSDFFREELPIDAPPAAPEPLLDGDETPEPGEGEDGEPGQGDEPTPEP